MTQSDFSVKPFMGWSGNGIQDGINDIERQSVMTFWSMASSPLYVGGDLANLDRKAASILTNREVIAVNQAGVIPAQVTGGTLQIWNKRCPAASSRLPCTTSAPSPPTSR